MAAARSLAALQTRCAECAVPHRGTGPVYDNGYGGRMCAPCAVVYTAAHCRHWGTSEADIAAVIAGLFGEEAPVDTMDALLGKVFAADGGAPEAVVGLDPAADTIYVSTLPAGAPRALPLKGFLLALAGGEITELPMAPGGAEFSQDEAS